jgi:hypothetical protein
MPTLAVFHLHHGVNKFYINKTHRNKRYLSIKQSVICTNKTDTKILHHTFGT